MKKIFMILLFFFGINTSYTYTSQEYLNIPYSSNYTKELIYTIPEGKDFIIDNIEGGTGGTLTIYNDDEVLYVLNYNNLSKKIIIKDNLYLDSLEIGNIYNISGFLVNEEENINNYINGNESGINANVFTKKDIDFIYLWEFIIIFFLMYLTFFYKLIRN